MRREPEYFQDNELELIYIAKKLKEALRLEDAFTEAGVDYAVEPDRYRGGVMFQAERVGAFFYVLPDSAESAAEVMARLGLRMRQ